MRDNSHLLSHTYTKHTHSAIYLSSAWGSRSVVLRIDVRRAIQQQSKADATAATDVVTVVEAATQAARIGRDYYNEKEEEDMGDASVGRWVIGLIG